MMDGIEVRPALGADVEAAVRVHLESFPGFFLTSLGTRFLTVFYDSLRAVDTGVLLVATSDDEVVGFVGGATDQAGLYRAMLISRRREFVTAAMAAAVRHPTAFPRLIRARARARGDFEYLPGASLMTLGVAPDHGRKGVGRALVEAFSETMIARGVERYSLTTDAVGNDSVNAFYRSLDFRLHRELKTREGRRLNEFVRELPAA